MESDTDKSIIVRDTNGDHGQQNNVTTTVNPTSSTVKINRLSIDLGIVKEKGDAQKCSHFSIRDYAVRMRERGGTNYLPFTNEELPPMEVPRFKYWLCQSCLQDCGNGNNSQEVALVSHYGKSMVQPCRNSFSPLLQCNGFSTVITRPFGEGTSGVKSVEMRNNDENALTVSQEDTIQSSRDTPSTAIIEEFRPKLNSIETNVVKDSNILEENHAKDVNDPMPSGTNVQLSIPADQQADDPSGHPRRKARKVRLLTELLCGNKTEEPKQKKESIPVDLSQTTNNSSPSTSSQIKRKIPQAQDRRPTDVISQSQTHVAKKVKLVKNDATVKNVVVEKSRNLESNEGGNNNTEKYKCKKHGNQKSSKLGSDPVAAWRSIFSDIGRGTAMPPPQQEKKISNKKILDNPIRNQLFGEDIQRTNCKGRDRQSETGLGLGLSLHYDPQSHVSLPPMPNRGPIQEHGRKTGFYFGESSINNHRVEKGRSGYDVRDGYTPITPRPVFPQEQQHYHAPLSHGNFSPRQNLDFSDPHNKRNNGVRGYSDVHQRQEMFSNGRSDEKEIAELMAKIQHDRNLSEARNYCVPGGSNNNNTNNNVISSNASNFRKVNSNQGFPIPAYPYSTMRRPPSMPNSDNSTTMRNPAFNQGLFMPNFDSFPQCRKQQSNGIRINDSGNQRRHNSNYNESRGNISKFAHQFPRPTNTEIMEAFHKFCEESPKNVWPNTSFNWNKGKSVMNLDLNVTATAQNAVDEQIQNHMEVNQKQNTSSLDSSYSNEAIPAMQLLSLMDAGKSSVNYNMEGKKLAGKHPFSPPCYAGKPNSGESCHSPYSGMQSGMQKPIENSRSHFVYGNSSPVTSSFSSIFNPDHERRQFHHKKPKGMPSSSSINHSYRSEDHFVFPLPWHANEDSLGHRNVKLGTEICTINQNPADFSSPGPENAYMINGEDLKFRERCYKNKFSIENHNNNNGDGQKWQKR